MTRLHRTNATPLKPVPDHHPSWTILETQGLELEKVRVLAELIIEKETDDDLSTLAACLLDAVTAAERERTMALDALRPDVA
jgi:hypothetical protein